MLQESFWLPVGFQVEKKPFNSVNFAFLQSQVRFSSPEYCAAAFLVCILCYGILFSTTINWELPEEKYLQGYQYTELFEEFLLLLVLQLCNYVNKNFFSLETVSSVNISRGFFQHF